MSQAAAPLFRDPIHDGAADPTVIWNPHEKAWWLLYTNRRANVACSCLAHAPILHLKLFAQHQGAFAWQNR